MKLLPIETTTGKIVVVNAEHIASIAKDSNGIIINLSNGHQVTTRFENIDHAIDYIFKATEELSPLLTGTN